MWIVVLLHQGGSPGRVLATFFSLIAAGACAPCNIRTAVLVPLADLGGELKQAEVILHLSKSIQLKWCSSSVGCCLLSHRNGPLEKRHFQKTGGIRVGVCSLSHWTCGVKSPDWFCHHHRYKCCT